MLVENSWMSAKFWKKHLTVNPVFKDIAGDKCNKSNQAIQPPPPI
jgi:hypothetical protein